VTSSERSPTATGRGRRRRAVETFSLHADVQIGAHDRAGLERLCRSQDVLACPCGGRRRVLAFITDTEVAKDILTAPRPSRLPRWTGRPAPGLRHPTDRCALRHLSTSAMPPVPIVSPRPGRSLADRLPPAPTKIGFELPMRPRPPRPPVIGRRSSSSTLLRCRTPSPTGRKRTSRCRGRSSPRTTGRSRCWCSR
jgi:hypothetical protein